MTRRTKWILIAGALIFVAYAAARIALHYLPQSGVIGMAGVIIFVLLGMALIGWLMVWGDNSAR